MVVAGLGDFVENDECVPETEVVDASGNACKVLLFNLEAMR